MCLISAIISFRLFLRGLFTNDCKVLKVFTILITCQMIENLTAFSEDFIGFFGNSC
jgi:hypothetical protein